MFKDYEANLQGKMPYYNKYEFHISPHDKWSGIVESLCKKQGSQREVNNKLLLELQNAWKHSLAK